jgi:exopolyphosphatase/guanosine-5'-triphosphate,3'-diphosphate pyrophosphatase
VRVAVVDVGTNSTRLLIAEGDRQLARDSIVTRLGDRVDASGRLHEEAQARALAVIAGYAEEAERLGCERRVALMTSAVRDAANGPQFAARVSSLGFDGRILSGEEEARLTFAGATAGRDPGGLAVIDIGGGSTEIVTPDFHTSLQVGVVRQGERHADLDALATEVRAIFAAAGLPTARHAIGVAGTPTTAAAIDLGGYDPDSVEGYRLTLERLDEIRARLIPLSPDQLAAVPGVHPARARVLLPGLTILTELMRAMHLGEIEASERDILWGAAAAWMH